MRRAHDGARESSSPVAAASPGRQPRALADINLNLLVALDALLLELSVTRAAARLGVTQSAMSHSLRQLRGLLDDDILVRGPRGMAPTPRAEALALPVRRALANLAHALAEPTRFDAARSTRRFRISAGDYLTAVLLPPLLAVLAAEAPGVDLEIVADVRRHGEPLEAGTLNLAIAVGVADEPGLMQQRLWDDEMVTMMRADHPAARRRLSATAFAALNHVLISPQGDGLGIVDVALARLGKGRRIAVRLPHFLAAPLVMAGTDLVLTAPRQLAALFAALHGLRIVAPPLTLPGFTVVQVWHARFAEDPGLRWLRELVARAARQQVSSDAR